MNYRIKQGFTLIKVCDTHLLVAKRSLWDNHTGIMPIPKKYALCWSLMEKGKTSDEVIRSMAELLSKPYDEVAVRFASVFNDLAKDGYLEEVGETDQ